MTKHVQVLVKIPGRACRLLVDEGIAGIVRELWQFPGIRTHHSCQGSGDYVDEAFVTLSGVGASGLAKRIVKAVNDADHKPGQAPAPPTTIEPYRYQNRVCISWHSNHSRKVLAAVKQLRRKA